MSNGHMCEEELNDSGGRLFGWLRNILKGKSDTTLREALEEYIEDAENGEDTQSVSLHEGVLISNVLDLRNLTVLDVMIPRADIIAIDIKTSQEELLSLLAEKQHSRIPVYRENQDDIVGTVHIKDILVCLAKNRIVEVENLIRSVPVVSPSMPIMDLILMMKEKRKHMALVVDEFGGIDGLVTIGDVIEAIIGEMDDEYDEADPEMIENKDGTLTADARVSIEEFEEKYGKILNGEDRGDIDTLAGLVFSMAGRIPARGEILTHPSGIIFEITDAGPRRVNKVLLRNIPLR